MTKMTKILTTVLAVVGLSVVFIGCFDAEEETQRGLGNQKEEWRVVNKQYYFDYQGDFSDCGIEVPNGSNYITEYHTSQEYFNEYLNRAKELGAKDWIETDSNDDRLSLVFQNYRISLAGTVNAIWLTNGNITILYVGVFWYEGSQVGGIGDFFSLD